jgi:hypothetical protein
MNTIVKFVTNIVQILDYVELAVISGVILQQQRGISLQC